MIQLYAQSILVLVRTGVGSGWSIVSICCLGLCIHTVDVRLLVVHRCVLPGLWLTSCSVFACLVFLILNARDQTELDLTPVHQNSALRLCIFLCILEPT